MWNDLKPITEETGQRILSAVSGVDAQGETSGWNNLKPMTEETGRKIVDAVAQNRLSNQEALDNRIKKFYTGNLGAVNIADSDDGAVRNLVIGGKSEQFSTTGKNILDFSPYTTNESGDTYQYFPVPRIQKGKTYVISLLIEGNVSIAYKNAFVFMSGKTQLVNKTHGSVFTSEYDYTDIDKFYIYTTADLCGLNVIGAQIEEGDHITDYEPYTGGAPSPSPDYPQEIKSVENCSMNVSNADGTETQTAPIPFTLRGIGDVRDELYVYADGTGKLVRRYPETLDPTRTVAEQALDTPIETTLTAEQVKALFDLRTYYGGTNISYQSENGVEPVVNFDYACALENFVEYIKVAQGDDRKFVYDMDERMTDAEYVAALAYVNSEYAAALTELEV